MKKTLKILALSAAAAIILTGCGSSIDKDKLAELTATKSFSEIKQSYILSIAQQKNEDTKIYAYWLKENGEKAEATFDYEMFDRKIQNQYKAEIKKLEDSMVKIKSNVDDIMKKSKENPRYVLDYKYISQLKNLKRQYSFFAMNNAYIKNTYLPFIKSQISILQNERDLKKKNRGF